MEAIRDVAASVVDAAAKYDRPGCEQGVVELKAAPPGAPPSDLAREVLTALKGPRYFDLMVEIGQDFRSRGLGDWKALRLIGQAFIEEKRFGDARETLGGIRDDIAPADPGTAVRCARDLEACDGQDRTEAKEYVEALGLLGRCQKQEYVDRDTAGNRQPGLIIEAIDWYRQVFDYDERHWWHAVNVVACVARATRDGIEVPGIDDPAVFAVAAAERILADINSTPVGAVELWDFGSASECALAIHLARGDEESLDVLLSWLMKYATHPGGDAFEYNSTLRQFTEVWQLRLNKMPGKEALKILEAQLLSYQGASLDLGSDVAERREAVIEAAGTTSGLEKRFGEAGGVIHETWERASRSALLVAHLHRGAKVGGGTGFLIWGPTLSGQLDEQYYILTNDHVISLKEHNYPEYTKVDTMLVHEAVATFELAGGPDIACEQIVWTSDVRELDATLVTLQTEPDLPKGAVAYELAPGLPERPKGDLPSLRKVYIVGHPGGGPLTYALDGCRFLDHDGPPDGIRNPEHVCRIHYLTPTLPGNSGSPLFNEMWQLLGIHHSGKYTMKRLNDSNETYNANEGIWIQSIRQAMTDGLGWVKPNAAAEG